MPTYSIINNQDTLLHEEIAKLITHTTRVKMCVNYFSYNALYTLIESFSECQSIEILINSDSFESNIRQFIYDVAENETNSQLQAYYRLNLVTEFAKTKLQLRKGRTGGNSFIVIDDKAFQLSPHNLNEPALGHIKDAQFYMITMFDDSVQMFEKQFSSLWANSLDCKKEILNLYQQAKPLKHPSQIYNFTISQIFENKTADDINEERLVSTGFKNSVVWNMLYNFQRDAVLGAIDKIEKYKGCIIADSVGLGKTFEALAIIKYYELRNDRVLVLAPKKLRENWITYRLNDKQNILLNDRFNFDVLNHTDLSRIKGLSGDINLETINWGNYDLLVIDESHNFRNNNPSKNSVSRYERLMKDVIKSGVKTKVLMLSATPVNTRLSDLRNQLAFITESDDEALVHEGIANISNTLKTAQAKFNSWMKEYNPSREALIESLGGDYFKLLDIFTISRSRKHIEKYYDVTDIGPFPERLKPISIYSDFDTQNKDFSITDINHSLEQLNLKFYSPMAFVLDHKREAYSELYDTKTKTGAVFTQLDREESIITLMRVNLLKRLESSIYSFVLTLRRLLSNIDGLLSKIEQEIDFIENSNVHEFDFDDPQFEDLIMGGKVKVLIQDMDLILFREELESDRVILKELLLKTERITSERDQKMKDLMQLIRHKIEEPINAGNKKILVFSAFADTVKYLYEHCAPVLDRELGVKSALVTGSSINKTNLESCRPDFANILMNFSPISKYRKAIAPHLTKEIDILFSTDCISEGQNLQDCDYLVNYDIHWNPVRIIQRFGRIDRIGSHNKQIQLVNFYPDIELDGYIDLIDRVKGRMQILDISATGDDNIIDDRAGQSKELAYRKKQLEQMKESVIDMEDLEGGISISDLTFNDFKVDADRVSDTELAQYELYGSGLFSLVQNSLAEQPAGVLFCLKDITNSDNEQKLKSNLLHPYALVYIDNDGTVQVPARLGKRGLDLFKKLAHRKESISEEQLKAFNMKTKSGRYMTDYVALLDLVKNHLTGQEKQDQLESIFNPSGSLLGGSASSSGNYEVVSYLIVT